MRIAVLIYAGSLDDRALQGLAGGPSAYERVLEFARALPDLAGGLVLEAGPPLPEGAFPRLRRESWTDLEVLEEARRFCAGLPEPVEALVLVRADEPLLDADLTRRMLANYRRYRAEYCFADGYPLGLAPEIVHPRILPALAALAAASPLPPKRGWLFTVLQRDINSFDIETEISPRDLRDRRLTLACDSKRNVLLLERLMEAGVRGADTALEIIPARSDLLRTLPAFVAVQVSGGCPQACALCPWPAAGGDILSRRDFFPLPRFGALMEGLELFAGDAVVDLSLWGEPSLHPDFPALVDAVLARPGLSLIVETSGLGWKAGLLEPLAARHRDRIDWIVSLDAATPELYGKLRGEGWSAAQACVERLLALWPGRVHPQLVRSRENEEELETFFRGWKAKAGNVIIQKYSRFGGRLPELKVADLSPLERRPCWHLLRDLDVLLDGSLVPCREMLDPKEGPGSLFEGLGPGEAGDASHYAAALARLWKAGEGRHLAHVAGQYPPPCGDCDEYHTFNA